MATIKKKSTTNATVKSSTNKRLSKKSTTKRSNNIVNDKVVDGRYIADIIEKDVEKRVKSIKKRYKHTPCLYIISAGNDPASHLYIGAKEKACNRTGIEFTDIHFDKTISEKNIIDKLIEINNDNSIDGVIVQLPLYDHLDSQRIAKAIPPLKDADCLNPYNLGNMFYPDAVTFPCTPNAIINIIKAANVDLDGKKVVILGRSNIVGKPLSLMLLKENATVTTCHSRTKSLMNITRSADILISAIGKPEFITRGYVKQDAFVIDVGISRTPSGIKGDVCLPEVIDKVKYITPVPGGVGPCTVAMLLNNTVNLCEARMIKTYSKK